MTEHLNLCYIMPSTCRLPPAKNDSQPRVAAIFYIFYEDLVEYCYQYAASLPSGIDVFVVTTDSKVAEKSRNFFGRLANKVEYRHQPNRGRDNAALLVTCKDIFTSYDLFCFMHGKKSKYSSQDAIRGEEFRAHCFVCLLHNENYVRNIIETFRSKERLGLMVPLLPTGFGYDYIIYDRWGPNHAHAERFIKDDLKMDVSLDPDVIAPYGGMFWARTGALKTVVGRGWGYEDFPEEPFPANDGLLPHVLERVLPLLAQHDGYYTAMAAPEFYANAALTTLFSMPNKMRATIPGDIVTYISLYGRYLRYCLLLKLPFPKYREKYLDKKYRLRAKFNRLKNLLIS